MKKRIAVCISGQLRTWEKVIDSWQYIVNDNVFDIQIDYFLHLFSENTIPTIGVNQIDLPLSLVDKKEVNKFLLKINPVNSKIESQSDFIKTIDSSSYVNPYICQYYSMWQAAKMKYEYEIQNNFRYDIVIKSRYDLLFKYFIINPEDKIEKNSYYGYNPVYFDDGSLKVITDLFFYSDSETFDIISNYYNEINNLPEQYKNYSIEPEYNWFYFLNNKNIKIFPNHWDIKVMRNNYSEIKNKDMSYETL